VGEQGDSQIHVFDGEVEFHPEDRRNSFQSLLEGEAVSFHEGNLVSLKAARSAFANPGQLREVVDRERERQWKAWRAASEKRSEMEDLAIYYDFRTDVDESWLLKNLAQDADENSGGTIIGCEDVSGRWPQKAALKFTGTSDRVLFRLEGETPSATMLAWVQVDSLPHDHNALLSMAPGEVGEINWKLDQKGRLLLGLRSDDRRIFESWERLVSPPIVTRELFGHWLMLATVVDAEERELRAYANGELVASAPLTRAVPVKLGKANLGTFDATASGPAENPPTRTFNGRFDEFAFVSRALSVEEIRSFQ
jgi:hypothetical protein